MKKSGTVFFERGSWYHRTKAIDAEGNIKYGKKGGFKSEREAVEAYKEAEKKYKQEQRKIVLNGKNRNEVMLKDYLVYWHEEIFSKRIESTTYTLSAYVLYDWVIPNIEQDIKLRYVNVEYMDALLERVSRCCASAGNTCRTYLHIAFSDAVAEGYIPRNIIIETKSYKRKKPTVKIFEKERLKRFLSVASKDEWYLEYLLGLFCGLRKGEIMGLKFSDFNLQEHTVNIQRQLGVVQEIEPGGTKIIKRTLVEKDPKTENSVRTLRIPKLIEIELEKRRAAVLKNMGIFGENYNDNDYVSCQKNGKPHNTSSMNIALDKVCRRNGLPKITVHSLRHMFATILIEQSVPLIKISALLGHSSINTTFEYYCDVMDENDNIIDFLNEKYTA